MVALVADGAMEEKEDGWGGGVVCKRFAESDCERTAVAEDVLYTVINSRPNVIYGPTTAVL